jgi:hypothetical protein
MSLFQPRRAPPAGGGNNFDPLHSTLVEQQSSPTRALSNVNGGAQRNLLQFVDNVAQAALKARNEFLVRRWRA